MSNPHTFRKTGPRSYFVTVTETGAELGEVARVSPDHHKTHPHWRATPAGRMDAIGSHYYSRDAAAHALADHAADDAEGITPAPSRLYGFRRPPTLLPGEDPATVVQVVERTGGRWLGTPARYNAASLADLGSGATLAIDAGAGWRLSQGDTAALAAYARGVLAEAGALAAVEARDEMTEHGATGEEFDLIHPAPERPALPAVLWLCGDCYELTTGGLLAQCADGCARHLDHVGACDPREHAGTSCMWCGAVARLTSYDSENLDDDEARELAEELAARAPHDPECTGCAHDCPWRRTPAPFGAPWCSTCDDHAEAAPDVEPAAH